MVAKIQADADDLARTHDRRTEADRQASMTLVVVAVGVTALILASLLIGSLLFSLIEAVR